MSPKTKKPFAALLRTLLLVSAVVLTALPMASAQGPDQIVWPSECVEGGLVDPPFGQKTLVCMPDLWNGAFVIYAHGYVAPQEELALPVRELTQIPMSEGGTLIDTLLQLGFGFATSSYSKNGWAVEQAGQDLLALVSAIEFATGGTIPKVFLVGASEGGLITTMLIEQASRPLGGPFDGGLAMCGPVGGMPYQTQYVGDFRVAFDYFYPKVFDFGGVDVPLDAYLDWEDTYAPAIEDAILRRPRQAAQLFRVTQAAQVPWQPETWVNSAQVVLRYSIVGTNDMIETAGGIPYDNQDVYYSGSRNDRRLNRKIERVAGEEAGLAYVQHYYQTTGQLEVPLVTIHTLLDEAVPFQHEIMYHQLVQNAGNGDKLIALPVVRYGHCNFEPEEVLGALALLVIRSMEQQVEGLTPYLHSLPAPMD